MMLMRTHTILWIVAMLIAVFSAKPAFSQHDHSSHGGHGSMGHAQMDMPPHGGVLKDAGKYRVEMTVDLVMMQDRLAFYIFKGNMKPLSGKDVTGSITFLNPDGTSTTTPLVSRGGNHFVAQLENTEPFSCTVEFVVKGKPVSAVFSHKGLGHGHADVYTCPMHPDIQSDGPGKCPKCGMFLEKAH